MKKAIYIPDNATIMVINDISDTHVKVFLDSEEKTVLRSDIKYLDELFIFYYTDSSTHEYSS